jgi:hypothetical protein
LKQPVAVHAGFVISSDPPQISLALNGAMKALLSYQSKPDFQNEQARA